MYFATNMFALLSLFSSQIMQQKKEEILHEGGKSQSTKLRNTRKKKKRRGWKERKVSKYRSKEISYEEGANKEAALAL